LLDQLTEAIEDPAETFACSFRLTGRLFRRRPQESRILLVGGLDLQGPERGLGPRALRDITNAAAAGRFSVDDPNWRWPSPEGRSWGSASCCRRSRSVTTLRPPIG